MMTPPLPRIIAFKFSRLLLCTLAALTLHANPANAASQGQRKRVAVVLSGGGAKGMAHIGVLRVLERAGIPVDIVTGTSMGSIVGGLYAVGFNAQQLDSMVRVQDWTFLLSDKQEAHSQLLDNRRWQNTYALTKTITFQDQRVANLTGGFIEGTNLKRLFRHLTAGYNDSIDFNRLPRPFACVATDIITNTEYVYHSGVLADAMRSSMAIPGVFSPMRKGDMVLVDGGLRNNFPVDVALDMGADVVIGVTVQGAPKTADDMKSTTAVLSQIVDVNCKNKYDDNLSHTDVAIRVNTKGYSSASFNLAAIDTLIRRGEDAAMAKWDDIMALKQRIGIDSTFVPQRYTLNALATQPDTTAAPADGTHPATLNAGLGVRFDTEEIVALQLSGNFSPRNSPWNAGATLRLGKRIMARADMEYKPIKKGGMKFSYIFRHNDINVYDRGDRAYNVTYNQHTIDLAPLILDIRNFKLTFGARFDYFAYNELLYTDHDAQAMTSLDDEHLVSYYAHVDYNSENKWLFPTRGARFQAQYRYHTDNFAGYRDKRGYSEVAASWRMTLPLSGRLMLQPMAYGRLLFGSNVPMCSANMVGGYWFGHYTEQQMPMAGVGHVENTPNQTIGLQLLAHQRIADNNYVAVALSALQTGDKLSQLFDHSPKIGALLGYAYDSMLGPLGASLGWSTLTHSPYLYINLGFEF